MRHLIFLRQQVLVYSIPSISGAIVSNHDTARLGPRRLPHHRFSTRGAITVGLTKTCSASHTLSRPMIKEQHTTDKDIVVDPVPPWSVSTMSPSPPPLYTIPMDKRPKGYGSWFSAIFFPIIFNLGILGINSAQGLLLLLLLIPVVGRDWYDRSIGWTKDGFGRLLIAITVLFAPTSMSITTDLPPDLEPLIEVDANGDMVKINLPDRLVVMANHQLHVDWIWLWILACYAGHAEGIIIILKHALRKIPFAGWGMRAFDFIFLKRSWAADKDNLTRSLSRLALKSKTGERSPLWLLIFPEGTIPSDEERVKSTRYAKREGIDDLVGVLLPRSTGLHFSLRTLLPSIPDLQLLDITIAYPGAPFGKYPQEWYGLPSVFWRGVPPPTIRMHLKLYSDLGTASSEIPGLQVLPPDDDKTSAATLEAQARAFELWLRKIWTEKSERLERMLNAGDTPDQQVVPIRQLQWKHWVAAFGAGGMGTAAVLGLMLRSLVH